MVLRNMRLPKRTPIITYRFLALLLDKSCRYRVFCLSNDEHVRAMFASHERILTDQVMQLYVQVLEMRTTTPGAGPSDSGPAVDALMTTDPGDTEGPISDRAMMSSCRLHQCNDGGAVDQHRGRGDDYDLDRVQSYE
ncbi:hypothetical protein PIB30_059893 [Stylosanthes scabra]|uniref:Uncharacterized protein n=1 Tax=Stylosanthes scabra TaxID=79078 RepID=A0ABU6XIA4_9FABA|nr:hypothetical protein [Stylosanthes scabra]